MLNYFPKYFSTKAILFYVLVLLVFSFTFSKQILPLHWILSGFIELTAFFYFLSFLTKKWIDIEEKLFLKKIFWTALIIRVIYVIFSYFFYTWMTGIPFEFSTADAYSYHNSGMMLADGGFFNIFSLAPFYFDISDMGRPITLGLLYSLFGKYILIPRLFSAVLSAWMCVLIYKFTKRNFGVQAARIASIMCLLMPNFIYYCGLHLKETDMIFLTVLFLERADYALRANKFSFNTLIIPILAGGTLFFFRTVLAVSAWLAFFSAILLSSGKLMGWWKRILIGFWFLIAVFFIFSGKIEQDVNTYWKAKNNNQSLNMEWRSKRKEGNKLADKGSTALFAPVILMAPFPTLVNVETQQNQMYQNGTYVVKNILSFFVYLALFLIIFRYKSVRQHVLLFAFIGSYLAIIAMSAFALSERFHLPVLPMLVVLAAFGITQVNQKNKKVYIPYLILLAIVIIGWNWFKLAGRGMV